MARDERRAGRAEESRIRMLQAGLDLLRDESTNDVFETLSARRVVAHAGTSAGSFYSHFDSADSFVDQLLTYSLEQSPVPEQVLSAAAFEATLRDGGSFSDAVIAGGAEALRFSDSDATWAVQFLVRAKASRNGEAKDRLRRMYDFVSEAMAAYYEFVVTSSNRELRPPYSYRNLVTAILCAAEGAYIRRAVTPEDVPNEFLGELMLAMLELYTRPRGDDAERREWLDDIGRSWKVELPEA